MVVVAATGPGCTQAQLDYVRGKAPLIVISDNAFKAPWADVLYSADAAWWRLYMRKLGGFAGMMVGAQDDIEFPRVHVIRHDGKGKKSAFDDPGYVWGNNSGAEAVQLAAHMNGGAPIVALGCDCADGANGEKHNFGDHPAPLRPPNYPLFQTGFALVAGELAKRGVKVWNCSPLSALTYWPKVPLETVL